MELLRREDILLINFMTVESHGGAWSPPDNILKEAPLEYLIEAVDAESFGQALYPEIPDKAAMYMHKIISGHIFQDGNKRTGLEAALLFLRINGYRVSMNPVATYEKGKSRSRRDEVFHFTMEMAAGKLDYDAAKSWFEQNIEAV